MAIYVLTPYLVVTLIFAALQRKFLYPASREPDLRVIAAGLDPETVTDVELHAAGGLALHGWHFSAQPAAATPDERFLVLFFPGNAGNRRDRILDCREFARLHCDVLLFDHRGYGDNGGSPSEDLIAVDARRAWMYALHDASVPPERIVIFGESLGGAVAVRLAAEMSAAGTPPAGLVLNSTFAALPETVRWHYPAFPFQFVLLDRYPSVDRIPHVSCPILQFHGTDDEFVPLAHGRRLFEAAPDQSADGVPKQFVPIEQGTHNALPVSMVEEELAVFLARLRETIP
jgi:fermentation-respiration switch protein FrsA (DUF1100 family)